ncbi:MAG: alkaline phosphatase family protein [Bryobacteraceae bacterium]|jgi:YVTN family beta-propeller protein
MKQNLSFLFVMLCAIVLSSQPSVREQVGKQPDGSFLLATGWRIHPAGTQIPLDTLPMSSALSPDGKFLLVLNGGYKPPSISVMSVTPLKEISRVPVADGWLGLTFSPNGKTVYVGGGSRSRVFEFTFSPQGELKPSREDEVTPAAQITPYDFIGDVAVSPDGHLVYAADLFHDAVVVINTQSGKVIERFKTGRRPYRILLHPDGKSFFVTSWSDGTVYQHDAGNGTQLGLVRLGPHTTDMVLSNRKLPDDDDAPRYRLFVAAANTNNVFVVGVNDSKAMKAIETINVALTPRQPVGMTPSAVALSTDQTKLFVTCSDANAVAVADISEARSRVAGFLPTGWYPTASRMLPDGRVLVLNGRGLASYPNPGYPGPKVVANVHAGDDRREYVGTLQTGTMSVFEPLSDEAIDEHTKMTRSLMRYKDSDLDVSSLPNDSVIYSKPGRPSPIEHVIYIVKENRTYDQVFGKIGKGNSDPSLTLFDESAAPNHYKLAREFVLFDNFYVNADVSADGHNWAIAGIAPDFVQKLWPNSYAKRRNTKDNDDYEGGEPANSPPAGYFWTNALSAGLSVRNYGYWVVNKKQAGPDGIQIEKVNDPALKPVTNMRYRSFDLDYPDVERAKVFLDDLKQFEASGTMPRLMLVRLGNDHTNGTTPGKLTPLSLFADNDQAVGMLVEGVSNSRFWAKTAIFVIEDDAQNGPDHVDSHRSPLLVVSPYTRRGIIDSSMYNQSSVLRTMELILGMRPLTHFDAGARPIAAAFASSPNTAPYVAEKPRISLTDRNAAGTATAALSRQMDFSDADRIDDDELNDILWTAIKGTEPPPPVRSYFSRQ